MKRLHVICEGQTEEMFVNALLVRHFESMGTQITPSRIGPSGHKGGNFKIERLLTDLEKRLLGDKACFCTTLFDFYGLPTAFPGKSAALNAAGAAKKSQILKAALTNYLTKQMGETPMRRFIPYVQMYEFEGLLFSDVAGFVRAINQESAFPSLQAALKSGISPEDINDSPITAPSKRILAVYSGYQKPLHGALAAIEIGLPAMRRECKLFDSWLSELESLTLDKTTH
jgi:hypothetical protein